MAGAEYLATRIAADVNDYGSSYFLGGWVTATNHGTVIDVRAATDPELEGDSGEIIGRYRIVVTPVLE